MAYSKKDALAPLYDDERLQIIEITIDNKLKDKKWMTEHTQGEYGLRYWEIVVRAELTQGMKDLIEQKYKAVGWRNVAILNSSENGEIGGLCRITLYE